jgi:hypothetical protein
MIYYIVKNVSEVTNAQLNVSGARNWQNTRLNKARTKCVLKFEQSVGQYFLNETWYTLDEIKAVLEAPEWDHESLGLWGKTVAFFKPAQRVDSL